MSASVIPFPTRPRTDAYFGGCPECGSGGNFANIGRSHWAACPIHKSKWCIGSNLFSGWREETEADWERNARELAAYTEVEPVFRKPTEALIPTVTATVKPAEPDKHAELVESFLRHWRAGMRPPEIHWAVRGDVPAATLEAFDAAADEAWRMLSPEERYE